MTTSSTDPNHFQCYELRRQAALGQTVTVEDAFASATGVLGRSGRICAPANKNGEDPTAPDDPDHLRSYQIRHPFARELNQTVVNQFGSVQLDVLRPDFILVPATKDFVQPPPLPTVPMPDHFRCYKVRRSRGAPRHARIRGVQIEDQFGPARMDLFQPRWLCAPADKNGEDPTAPDHPSHLLCYKARNAVRFAKRDAFLTDQFRAGDAVLIKKRMEFCVPSLRNPGASTTSTASPTTSTTTTSTTTTTLPGSPSGAFVDA